MTPDDDKRRNAGLSCGNDSTADRKQMEAVDSEKFRMRPWRFNELRRDLEGVSQKVLTDSLRAMEDDGIITRTVYPEVPPRVEYALSPLGKSMEPILDAMEQWGSAYQKMMNE